MDVDDLELPRSDKPYVERINVEYRIHVAIVDHLTGRKTGSKAFNAFTCHVFQGRSAEDGFFLKMLGVIAGVADLLVLWRSKCVCGVPKIGIGFLEVKKPEGYASAPQRKFSGICHWLGVNYAIVKSVGQAHEVLVKWGCPENHKAFAEPDVRTKQQKFKDAFEMYKP